MCTPCTGMVWYMLNVKWFLSYLQFTCVHVHVHVHTYELDNIKYFTTCYLYNSCTCTYYTHNTVLCCYCYGTVQCTVLYTVLYSTDRTDTVDRWIGITGTSTRTARVVSTSVLYSTVQCTTHNQRPFESGGPSPHATYYYQTVYIVWVLYCTIKALASSVFCVTVCLVIISRSARLGEGVKWDWRTVFSFLSFFPWNFSKSFLYPVGPSTWNRARALRAFDDVISSDDETRPLVKSRDVSEAPSLGT